MIVLTGQRRVGKSYVMKELVARKGNEPGNNVIYIDKGKRLSTLLSPIRIWSPMLTRR
ncbi:MAG: hypothetical protein LKK12_03995 [Bacteroidales bacterium]|nr:hypothetical protein [Bacteroidales bacterium]